MLSRVALDSIDNACVFSEMYYPQGWSVTIDKQKAAVFPANYVLRALRVPSGNHTIEFTFEPNVVSTGVTVRLFSLFVFLSIVSFFGFKRFKVKYN